MMAIPGAQTPLFEKGAAGCANQYNSVSERKTTVNWPGCHPQDIGEKYQITPTTFTDNLDNDSMSTLD